MVEKILVQGRGLILSDMKTFQAAIFNSVVLCKDREIDKWNKAESRDRTTHILLFDLLQNCHWGGRDHLFNKWCEINEWCGQS